MSTQLLDIQPRDLKFTFELKKQSSCSVRLANKTDFPVAFKVKTTSPKKYCVRPNVGIVEPKSACDFVVTMQAQRAAPPDLVCKDKFLVQSTIVPEGISDDDITSSMFSKDDGNYVEENKLKVILVSPPHSPVLSPINGVHKQATMHEAPLQKDQLFNGIEIISPQKKKTIEDFSSQKGDGLEEITLRSIKDNGVKLQSSEIVEDVTLPNNKGSEDISIPQNEIIENISLKQHGSVEGISQLKNDTIEDNIPLTNIVSDNISLENKVTEEAVESKVESGGEMVRAESAEFGITKDVADFKLVKDIDRMKSKLNQLELKLSEAEVTISKLTEERGLSLKERESLRKELAMLKSRTGIKRVRVGFPFLFVVMVALISIVLGYLLRC